MSAEDQLREIECPVCGEVGTIRLGSRFVSRPIGSFSLAGQQMKVSADEVPALVCSTPGCEFFKFPKGYRSDV